MAATAVLAGAAIAKRHDLAASVATLGHVRWTWIPAAIALESASMAALAGMQRRLLAAGGASVSVRSMLATTFAANALSVSVPLAGPELGTAFAFRRFTGQGADAPLAVWSLLIGGVVSAAAGVLLALGGGLSSGNIPVAVAAVATSMLAAAALAAAVTAARRPQVRGVLERAAAWTLWHGSRLLHRPTGDPSQVIRSWAGRLGSLRLPRSGWMTVTALALANWLADAAVFAVSIHAVGAAIPWHVMLLAYGSGVGAQTLNITPGGVGITEGTLGLTLVATGLRASQALAAVLLYRMVSFWLIASAGWLILLWLRRHGRPAAPAQPLRPVRFPAMKLSCQPYGGSRRGGGGRSFATRDEQEVGVAKDEDELWVGAMRTLIRRATGRRGWLVQPMSQLLLTTVAHELDLALPLPADAAMGRVESVLTSVSLMSDYPPRSATGRRRIRAIVAGGARGGMPVVVTVDLSPDPTGGTTLKLRALAKELIVNRRTAEKAAQAVAGLLTQPDGTDGTVAACTWFEVDPSDAAEMSGAELAFAAALRAHSSAWTPADVDGLVAGFAADGLAEPLVAYADLTDPANPGRGLLRAGVHLLGDRVRGDRLHSQLFSLPERPSSWALDSAGPRDQLAELSTHWFRRVLDKPIVLYVWLHDDYAYAARYGFADTGETLIQYYERELAPAGQAADLIAAGHVHGKGWIQTAGLPDPSCYSHIRGVLAKGTVLPGVPAMTKRGPLPGFWYEGH